MSDDPSVLSTHMLEVVVEILRARYLKLDTTPRHKRLINHASRTAACKARWSRANMVLDMRKLAEKNETTDDHA